MDLSTFQRSPAFLSLGAEQRLALVDAIAPGAAIPDNLAADTVQLRRWVHGRERDNALWARASAMIDGPTVGVTIEPPSGGRIAMRGDFVSHMTTAQLLTILGDSPSVTRDTRVAACRALEARAGELAPEDAAFAAILMPAPHRTAVVARLLATLPSLHEDTVSLLEHARAADRFADQPQLASAVQAQAARYASASLAYQQALDTTVHRDGAISRSDGSGVPLSAEYQRYVNERMQLGLPVLTPEALRFVEGLDQLRHAGPGSLLALTSAQVGSLLHYAVSRGRTGDWTLSAEEIRDVLQLSAPLDGIAASFAPILERGPGSVGVGVDGRPRDNARGRTAVEEAGGGRVVQHGQRTVDAETGLTRGAITAPVGPRASGAPVRRWDQPTSEEYAVVNNPANDPRAGGTGPSASRMAERLNADPRTVYRHSVTRGGLREIVRRGSLEAGAGNGTWGGGGAVNAWYGPPSAGINHSGPRIVFRRAPGSEPPGMHLFMNGVGARWRGDVDIEILRIGYGDGSVATPLGNQRFTLTRGSRTREVSVDELPES